MTGEDWMDRYEALERELTKKNKYNKILEESNGKLHKEVEELKHNKQTVVDLSNALVQKLEAQIEKMKCCGNCVSFHKNNEYPCDIGNNENSFSHNCCDCWKLKE